MKTIAKVLESMLTKDATQSWTVRTPATPGATNIWHWDPVVSED